MKCKRLRVKELRNEEWFQFYTAFKKLVEKHTAQRLSISEEFIVFLSLYADADEALEVIRKSMNTEPINDADITRDCTFRGFSDAVQSALNHFDPGKREAARKVQIVFDHYGNIAQLSNNQQTASTGNFLQEMRGARAADITLLGLTDWVDKLDEDNQALDALMEGRYDENAAKTSLRMKEVREKTDSCYRDIINRLDALMLILLNAEDVYGAFLDELNERISFYGNILAQRKGISKAKREKENKA